MTNKPGGSSKLIMGRRRYFRGRIGKLLTLADGLIRILTKNPAPGPTESAERGAKEFIQLQLYRG
jgi:hypothetical protein